MRTAEAVGMGMGLTERQHGICVENETKKWRDFQRMSANLAGEKSQGERTMAKTKKYNIM